MIAFTNLRWIDCDKEDDDCGGHILLNKGLEIEGDTDVVAIEIFDTESPQLSFTSSNLKHMFLWDNNFLNTEDSTTSRNYQAISLNSDFGVLLTGDEHQIRCG